MAKDDDEGEAFAKKFKDQLMRDRAIKTAKLHRALTPEEIEFEKVMQQRRRGVASRALEEMIRKDPKLGENLEDNVPQHLITETINELVKKNSTRPELSVGSVIIPEGPGSEGVLIRSTSAIWDAVMNMLRSDWSQAYGIPPRVWEEIIAGAYKKAGFDEVTLTPRSNDHGRDLIAVRNGVGSVRIIGSVKAYKPGHLITKEEVHALMGVVSLDSNASKGVFTTTSDFAPRLLHDPRLAASVPHRIELMNGQRLREWLLELHATAKKR
jgi:restriction system protein